MAKAYKRIVTRGTSVFMKAKAGEKLHKGSACYLGKDGLAYEVKVK